ncbi:ferredoxin [Frankia sp. Cr2]|uniref:ferredoxin n=1 Tax=Frankia sp. Cr2 TaxID=3073932 RepID=UPI002AD2498D|nr:ferredoxin [Frankia sp. Cr2]
MRAQVDPSLCVGHGRCNAYGTDVYGLDDAGYCHIGHAVVPTALEQQARDGAAACPERAISLSE